MPEFGCFRQSCSSQIAAKLTFAQTCQVLKCSVPFTGEVEQEYDHQCAVQETTACVSAELCSLQTTGQLEVYA